MAKKEIFEDDEEPTPHSLISKKAIENTKMMNKNTAIAYNRVWRDFSEFIDNANVHVCSDLNKSHVISFLDKYRSKPFAYNQALSAILKILSDIEDDGEVTMPNLNNIRTKVKKKKAKTFDRLFLTRKELGKVRDTANDLYLDRRIRERNLLIYDLMVHTMMRVDEVALIQLTDIDLALKRIGVRGKGSSSDAEGNRIVNATIKLSPKLIEQIIEYVRSWRIECKSDSTKPYLDFPETIKDGMPLFTSRQNKSMDVTSIKHVICAMISQSFKDKGMSVPKNHGPHCIRRSVATIIYNKGKDILLVQKLLRHASQVTTMGYIGIDQQELDKGYLESLE